MATNDIYMVRRKSDGTFEEILNSPFKYDALSATDSPNKSNNIFHINTKLRVDELEVNGKSTIIDQDTTTSEQLLVTNDGTGPAVVINQKGTEGLIDIQDDGVSALYLRGDPPYGGFVGLGTTTPEKQLELTGDILLANGSGLFTKNDTGLATMSLYQNPSNTLVIENIAGDGINFTVGTSTTGQAQAVDEILSLRIDDKGLVGIGGSTSPQAHLEIVRDGYRNISLKHKTSSSIEGEIDIDIIKGGMTVGTTNNSSLFLGTNNVPFVQVSNLGNVLISKQDVSGVQMGGNLTIEGELSLPNAYTWKLAGEETLYTDQFSVSGAGHSESFKFLEFTYPTDSQANEGSPFIIEIWSDYLSATAYQKYLVSHTNIDTGGDDSGVVDTAGKRDYKLKLIESYGGDTSNKFRIRLGNPEDAGTNLDGADVARVAVKAELNNYSKTRIKVMSLASETELIAVNDDWTDSANEYKFYKNPAGIDITEPWEDFFDPTAEDAVYASSFYGSRLVNNLGSETNPTSYFLKPADAGISMAVAGKVGIGTTTPIGDLQVHSDSSSGTNFYLTNSNDSSTNSDWRMQADSNGDFNLGAVSSSFYKRLSISAAGQFSYTGNQFNFYADPTLDPVSTGLSGSVEFINRGKTIDGEFKEGKGFQFWTNGGAGASEITFDATGKVGIGTDTPILDLDVYGKGKDIGVTSIHADGTRIYHSILGTDGDGNGVFGLYNSAGNKQVNISSKPSENSFINNGGNVGIGTDAANERLRITAGSNSRIMGFEAPYNSSGGQLVARLMGETNGSNFTASKISFDMVSTDGTLYVPALTLLSGGKVGVGTVGTDQWGTFHINNVTGDGTPTIDAWNQSTDSENAHAIVRTGVNPGGGDPYYRAVVNGEQEWSFGIDSSDENKFKINSSGALGNVLDRLTITKTGNVGIGTDSPSLYHSDHYASAAGFADGAISGVRTLHVHAPTNPQIRLTSDSAANQASLGTILGTDSGGGAYIINDHINKPIIFHVKDNPYDKNGNDNVDLSTAQEFDPLLDYEAYDCVKLTDLNGKVEYYQATILHEAGSGTTVRPVIGGVSQNGWEHIYHPAKLSIRQRKVTVEEGSFLEVEGLQKIPAGRGINQDSTELSLLTQIGLKSVYSGTTTFEVPDGEVQDKIFYFHLCFRGGNRNGFKYKAEVTSARRSANANTYHWVNRGFINDESFIYFEEDLDYNAQFTGSVMSVGDLEVMTREVYPTRDDQGSMWGMKALPAESDLTLDDQTNYIVRYGIKFNQNTHGTYAEGVKVGRLNIQLEVMQAGEFSAKAENASSPHFLNVT